MIRKLSIAAAAALTLAATPALAADWRLVTVDEDVGPDHGRSIAGFIDYDSLTRNGDRVTFWLMFVSEVAARSGMDHARARIRADCSTQRYNYLERVFYSGEEVLGRTGESDSEQASPDTNAAAVIEAACTGIPADARTVPDPYRFGQAALRALRERQAD